MEHAQIFKRHEKKYMLTVQQANTLLAEIQPFIRPDEYGRYTICSLYLDTAGFACYWGGKQGGDFKQKLRLRSYGVPRLNSPAYLELKKKLCGITYKRRVSASLGDAYNYLYGDVPPLGTSAQTLAEISWFKNTQCLEPKALLCYDRLAFAGIDQPALRITFDTGVRWRTEALRLEQGDWGRQLLPPGSVLLEIKTTDALPLWLTRRLGAAGAYPTRFSKYNHVVEEIFAEERRQCHAG